MKKLVIFSLIAIMVAGTVFAQVADGISVSAWGRGAFSPLIIQGKEKSNPDGDKVEGTGGTYVGTGNTFSADPTYQFYVEGANDFIGFGIGITSNWGIGADGPLAHAWTKPFGSDILKLTVGIFNDDTLRGKIGEVNDGFQYFVLPGLLDTLEGMYGGGFDPDDYPFLGCEEDGIFERFGRHYLGNMGFMLSSSPMEGLFLGLRVNTQLFNEGTKASSAYRYMQLGVGYETDAFHFRAQYLGGFGTDKGKSIERAIDNKKLTSTSTPAEFAEYVADFNKPASIALAFAFTGMEGLLVDLGTRIWFPVKHEIDVNKDGITVILPERSVSRGVQVGLGATYDGGDFGVNFRVDTVMGAYMQGRGKDHENVDPVVMVWRLVPFYKLDEVTVGLDLGLMTMGKGKDQNGDKDDDAIGSQLGFGGWVSKDLGNGHIKTGLSYTLPWVHGNKDNKQRDSGVFQIPVILEYSF